MVFVRLASVSRQRQDEEGIFNPIWRLRVTISHTGSVVQQLRRHRPSKTFRAVRRSYALLVPSQSLVSLQNYVVPQTSMRHFISANTLSDLQIAAAHVWVPPQRLYTGLLQRWTSSTIHSNICSTTWRLADNRQQLRCGREIGIANFRLKKWFDAL